MIENSAKLDVFIPKVLPLLWLVVSTHLKNISQIGSFPQVGVKIKTIWNHQPVLGLDFSLGPSQQKFSQSHESN